MVGAIDRQTWQLCIPNTLTPYQSKEKWGELLIGSLLIWDCGHSSHTLHNSSRLLHKAAGAKIDDREL